MSARDADGVAGEGWRQLGGEVEADETYIGGKGRNMHAGKRMRLAVKRGRSVAGKTVVMGLLERHGNGRKSRVRTEVLSSIRKAHIQGQVAITLRPAPTSTPMHCRRVRPWRHRPCRVLRQGQRPHQRLRNFWSLLKRAIKGTYVSVEPFHLFRYLDEQAFRFNERGSNDGSHFLLALFGICNKRLTYKALTGSELPETC